MLRIAILSLTAFAFAFVGYAEPAEAGGIRIRIGKGHKRHKVHRHHRRHHRHHRYVWRYKRVWVPKVLIGHDLHGDPIYQAGYWKVIKVRVRVW